MFILWFNAEPCLVLLRQDLEIAHMASVYLRWISLGLPGNLIDNSFHDIIHDIKAYTFSYVSRCVSCKFSEVFLAYQIPKDDTIKLKVR